MLYMSQARVSRSARRRAWLNRPLESLESPVKRYEGSLPAGPSLWRWRPRRAMRRLRVLRPVIWKEQVSRVRS